MNVPFPLGLIFSNITCEDGNIFFYVLKSFLQNDMQFDVHRMQTTKDKTPVPADQIAVKTPVSHPALHLITLMQ